jgi:hypothetical protein
MLEKALALFWGELLGGIEEGGKTCGFELGFGVTDAADRRL